MLFQSPPLQMRRCGQKMRGGGGAAEGEDEVRVVMVTGTEGLGQNASPRLPTSYNSSCPSSPSPSESSSMSCSSCSTERVINMGGGLSHPPAGWLALALASNNETDTPSCLVRGQVVHGSQEVPPPPTVVADAARVAKPGQLQTALEDGAGQRRN